ncbi:DUF3263 domain-containing protein [Nocardioides sp. SOB77]|uniref:DUF3263 domain-containing protein n=1 Tax=Nocardioides oceani TaxID=3058369 RepID=A0ABT8FGT1_9ACTN|nr:DUF3263 domain-containing protein [Nocardioides oceani]MDN4173898.1 DUF3263 domain-containing protein [Nocardioides oceani]
MDDTTEPAATTGLTHEDRMMLDFEHSWWKYAGAKETAIREQFALTSTTYYRRLNWIIDQPEALEHDALLVRRLRRLRTARHEQRSARRLGFVGER